MHRIETIRRWTREHGEAAIVVLVAIAHTVLLGHSAAVHSPTLDEVAHLPAGISHWRFGRFDLYRVNPPLIRMVAAAPVVLAEPNLDWSEYRVGLVSRAEFAVGADFVRANGLRSLTYFTWARWACIPFSLLGACVCWRWARALYGVGPGLVALVLWCVCPQMLGNGSLITPDVGAAAFGALAGYMLWRWIADATWTRALLVGCALGAAALTKSTWIILFALWPVVWIVCRMARRTADPPALTLRREFVQLVFILLVGLYLLNLGYLFRGSLTPLGDYGFISHALAGERQGLALFEGGNRFRGTWMGGIPVPLPADYVLGIDVQRADFEEGKWSYLRGEWRHGGWWYWYLYALGVKTPLGTLILSGLALIVRIARRGYAAPWRDEFVLLAPAIAVLVLVSSQTGFNRYVRYVLPAVPFLLIWASSVAQAWALRRKVVGALAAVALACAVVGSLRVHPHSLSFFNLLAGGPRNGHAHLVDANIDWGQDLLLLKRWIDDHPHALPLSVAYFALIDARLLGIDFPQPPMLPPTTGRDGRHPPPGWYAVSVNWLRGYRDTGSGRPIGDDEPGYAYFLNYEPVARIGYSINIYHIPD